jgi:hypothetical protein
MIFLPSFIFLPSIIFLPSFPPSSFPSFIFPPSIIFVASFIFHSFLPFLLQSMESIATTAYHKISDYMIKGRELWHIRTFTPLVEPPSTTVVGYSFVARHRKTSSRTETGSIYASGKFELSDFWLQGHGTQGALGCYALDLLWQEQDKDPTYYPYNRKWVSPSRWTETWYNQMSVKQPAPCVDTRSHVQKQICPPIMGLNTSGRPKAARYIFLCIYTHIHICMHAYIFMYIYTHTHLYACMYFYVCASAHMHMHVYT